ncbi:MAG TPA: hypothetical protein VIG06_20545 [Kofleriaceae bacterium]|jgi:hypothetical protein
MRIRIALVLVALFGCELSAQAGRTGQAKSAEVLARRKAASPRGAKEWGGTSMAFLHAGQKEVRRDLRRATPGSEAAAIARGKNQALVSIRDIVGKHLGLTPGQLASKDRRHDRAVVKQLRRMLREVRTARSNGRPFRQAFPNSLETSYRELETSLAGEISSIRAR